MSDLSVCCNFSDERSALFIDEVSVNVDVRMTFNNARSNNSLPSGRMHETNSFTIDFDDRSTKSLNIFIYAALCH